MSKTTAAWHGPDRRHQKASDDGMFRLMVGMNIVAWMVFIAAAWVFHEARPELSTGLQSFWGIIPRGEWLDSLVPTLLLLLMISLGLSVAVLILLRKRARRRLDPLGANIMILAVTSGAALIWILSQVR